MIVEWAAEAETKEKAQQILRDIIIALMPKPNQMSFLAKEGEKKWWHGFLRNFSLGGFFLVKCLPCFFLACGALPYVLHTHSPLSHIWRSQAEC